MQEAGISLQAFSIAEIPDEEEGADESDLCIVCWEDVREVIFYQCMHMVRTATHPCLSYCPAIALLKLVCLVEQMTCSGCKGNRSACFALLPVCALHATQWRAPCVAYCPEVHCIQKGIWCLYLHACKGRWGTVEQQLPPLIICGTCSAPARAVPRTSWQQEASVLCVEPRFRAPSLPNFESLAQTDQWMERAILSDLQRLCTVSEPSACD